MKKFMCILSAFLMLSALAGCSGNKETPTDSSAATTADGIVVNSYDEKGELVTEILSTTRFDGTTDPMSEVSVTVPSSYILTLKQEYQQNLQLLCTEKGYTSYSTDSTTGDVTFKMTASVYNNMLSEKRRYIFDKLTPLIESDTYPYFLGYVPNDSYTEVTLKVEKKAYEKADSSLLAEYIADMCVYDYQIFVAGASRSCTVTVKDAATDKVITQVTRSYI